ncbi:alpha-glycosidase [Cohnella mopanensis]|uniref:alpha-glycosidase n=1 Tax=Cohnella mopanensis TaxID=2911966 RepID=UPI001EF93FAB|nr:alpha-glycosidase [Cohnella mopanensis]
MLREAVYHRPKNNWSYAYDRETIHVRIRTKRDDVDTITLIHGDKYSWSVVGSQTTAMKIISQDNLFDYWQAEVKPPFRRLKYGFKFQSGNESIWMNEQGFQESEPENQNLYFDFPFLNPADVFTPPAWVKEAVFYQIFPERFANGDPSIDPSHVEPWGGVPTAHNFFGGDLQGIIDHLDYLTELGINAIYFNPLFEATTNHKYDTTDYMKIDPHFGTNDKMKQLVEACHARGIKVLLDAVFNHSGGKFPPFLDVLENGAESRYADWFHVREFPLEVRDRVPTYDAFAFEPHMPKLNTENAAVQEYLLEVARYWIEDIGVDGWRLDVANEVDHRFWRQFRDVVKAANPEAYILGEIWHDSQPWLSGDQFDAVMNYPLTEAIIDYAVKDIRDGRQFADLVGYLHAAYPQQASEVAFNLLGSHDTPRLLNLCQEDKQRLKLAYAIPFTLTGTPCIYYGDEIGLTGEHDPGCRKCMEWDETKQDRELFRFFAELVKLRKEHRALRDGTYQALYSESGDKSVAYAREADGEKFIIVLNADTVQASVTLPVENGSAYEVVFGEGEPSAVGNKLQVSLPPIGYAILMLQ